MLIQSYTINVPNYYDDAGFFDSIYCDHHQIPYKKHAQPQSRKVKIKAVNTEGIQIS